MVSGPPGPDYRFLTMTNLMAGCQALYTTNSPVITNLNSPLASVDTNLTDPARFDRIQIGP
jgi:hypothetical protein